MTTKRVLLVGEQNPYGSDPGFALFPLPPNASGGRLMRVLGMRHEEYLVTFDRVNLIERMVCECDRRRPWCGSCAESRARALDVDHPFKVLLGARVAKAHGVDFKRCVLTRLDARPWVVLPHPSGLSRLWNTPHAGATAMRLVRRLVNDVGWV